MAVSNHVENVARRLRGKARQALSSRDAAGPPAPETPPQTPPASPAAAGGPPLLGGRKIVAFDDMDDLLRRADEVERDRGYAAKAAYLNEFRLDPGSRLTSGDPDSAAYREAQMGMYREIAQIDDYDPRVHEVVPMNIEERIRQPAPFHDGSMVSAGNHLIAYGFMLRLLDLPPASRVIEYGPGNGNIALLMATMGLDVTAIDIGPDYIEIIRRRAENQGVSISAFVGEFGDPPLDGAPVDAILFYEAFHHSSDHIGLIRALRERLAPGGKVLFGGEPIVEHESRPWLGPWGLRLDGVSLLAIRDYKNLELGFTQSYFVRSLMRHGFAVTHHECTETGIADSWLARDAQGVFELNRLTLPPDEGATWDPSDPADPERTHRFARPQSRLTLDEDPRWNRVRVSLKNFLGEALTVDVAVGASAEQARVPAGLEATVTLALPAGRRELRVASPLSADRGLGIAVMRVELLP